jgi:hypothetical protein
MNRRICKYGMMFILLIGILLYYGYSKLYLSKLTRPSLLLENVDALADSESRLICYGVGSLYCPYNNTFVIYIHE